MINPARTLVSLLSAAGLAALAPQLPASSQALFNAAEVDQSKFVIVAAPIGDGSRAQLNIYEQRSAARPCFSVQGASPAVVNPLLATFDFTGICNRFIDANGYSVRVGGSDLATVYRLSVVRQGNDNQLLAIPTKASAGPEMVVARTGGHAGGFLLFVPEPGWKLMRRQFGGRALGHVYLYRDSWPQAAAPASAAPAAPLQGQSSQPTSQPSR
ncbi:MAG: DUF3747 domain-containing protein [Synechococcaceae bacterium WB8_1B_136]|nr:DUF3747 domain-containing protein [Synechococcaceae bacterium WB8_1B_136]